MTIQNLLINNLSKKKLKKIRKVKRKIKSKLSTLSYFLFGVKKSRANSAYTLLQDVFKDDTDSGCRWLEAFLVYKYQYKGIEIPLVWAETPIPGNYGDWLSPYVISNVSKRPITHVEEIDEKGKQKSHIISLGSIAGSISDKSIVLGTGIASLDTKLNTNARYVSVRGPYTLNCLDTKIENISFGDIGFALSKIRPCKTLENQESVLFVRHINHRGIKVTLPDDVKEISIFASHPDDIESIIDEIVRSKLVVTSAMHIFITANSYNIPAILIDFIDEVVPGDGVKYKDSFSGVGLPEVEPQRYNPAIDFYEQFSIEKSYKHYCSELEKEKIIKSIKEAVELFDEN